MKDASTLAKYHVDKGLIIILYIKYLNFKFFALKLYKKYMFMIE